MEGNRAGRGVIYGEAVSICIHASLALRPSLRPSLSLYLLGRGFPSLPIYSQFLPRPFHLLMIHSVPHVNSGWLPWSLLL